MTIGETDLSKVILSLRILNLLFIFIITDLFNQMNEMITKQLKRLY
jgi:hypothetical protein